MTDELIVTGETTVDPADNLLHIYGRIFDAGLSAGRQNAGNEELFEGMVAATLDCLLDEGAPEHVREKSFANLIGFTEGWREVMQVTPLQFLTRFQTWKVRGLPRAVRMGWMAEYKRGLKHWVKAGGSISGKRPVLPALPGEAPTPPKEESRIIIP